MPVTRLVRQDGSGAYLDHASAFLACGAGDTVETGDSETYTEHVTIYALAGQSWIVSPGCTPTVTFYSGNTVTVNDGATGLTINGVTIGNSGPNSCLHLLGESTGLVVDGCAFTGASATAISGAYYAPGQDVTLLDSTITCKAALYAPIFAALDVRRSTFAVTASFLRANSWAGTIDRCEITLSEQAYLSASIAYSGTYSGAVSWTNCLILDLTDASAITMLSVYDTTTPYSILGCTIVGVGAYALTNIPCIWMDVGAGNLGQIAICGNIITGFKSGLRGNFGTYTDAYNDVWGNGTNYAAGTAAGANSISADPLFVGGGDYHITGASPCINASANIGLTEDLDGNVRPSGIGYDIGCYEGGFTPPDMTAATPTDLDTLVVSFSEEVTGAGLTAPLSWSLVNEATLSPKTITGIVQTAPDTLEISTAFMEQDTQYRITAPATITDVAGNPIGVRTLLFTTAHYLTAYHESEQGLRIVFNAAVKQVNDLEADDALNTANYSVIRDDAGWYPAILDVIPRSSTEVTVKFAGPEVTRFEYATVSVSGTIAYVGGGTFPNVSCRYEGCAEPSRPLLQSVETSVGIRDLMMPQFGTEAGTLPIKSGDYQIETATDTMKKMCIRALSIAAGEFAHAPEFGSSAKVKAIAKPSELQRVSRDAKKSLLSLPNVLDAVVTTTAYNNGVLWVQATVKTRHLGTVSVSWAPAGAV